MSSEALADQPRGGWIREKEGGAHTKGLEVLGEILVEDLLRVETAITSVADLLEEGAEEGLGDVHGLLAGVDVVLNAENSGKQESKEDGSHGVGCLRTRGLTGEFCLWNGQK